ncbi:mitochondrial protein [Coprinopsis cinerea okayama7|uniref:Mitochondrial protein n=1 Tax=Coprinopsis cinerea (strain Okayama-7 / 130 / ATCC MYA-4618 / FGSC 9003) TaxID=240176 RepID=A8NUV1_COPC7|nr:mitochondrial protein [Coprinopsis cinerea okayama7\|eukprot:XP_001836540.2 mitochondrial protein [Coprinopsis cinerea okayama7\
MASAYDAFFPDHHSHSPRHVIRNTLNLTPRPRQITHSIPQPNTCASHHSITTNTLYLRFFKVARASASRIRIHKRAASTKPDALQLQYTVQAPGTNKQDRAVVILHGFFGSKRNWGTLSKTLMERLQRPVYALDLRNHGESPHSEVMTYEAMANDVWRFINEKNLSEVSLIGHSMGGKVAMSVALQAGNEQPPHTLNDLIVVDVSPVKGRISHQFRTYVDTLKEIQDLGLKTRKEAADHLARVEPDPAVRAFLLTNLLPFDKEDPRAKFMVPLNTFKNSIDAIGDFPYTPGDRDWSGRTLFVKGSRSQ